MFTKNKKRAMLKIELIAAATNRSQTDNWLARNDWDQADTMLNRPDPKAKNKRSRSSN